MQESVYLVPVRKWELSGMHIICERKNFINRLNL